MNAISRRQLLGCVVIGGAVKSSFKPLQAAPVGCFPSVMQPDYLTPSDQFGTVERGNPLPYTLAPVKLREVGLDRETWQLEVVADPESDTKIERPLSKAQGTALDWAALMKLSDQHAVRYLKVMTCNNIGEPLGVGLWEGVPLREVIWLTQPVENLRRVF